MDANLLITFDPAHAGRAEEEVKTLLSSIGKKFKFLESNTPGVFLVKTDDAKAAVKKLLQLCKHDASQFQYTYRWVPIDKWCSSKLDDMTKVMKEFDSKMNPEKKWKMDLVKRQYEEYSTTDLIIKLTDSINKPKVDLKNPEIIVKVEIIDDIAGCSLLYADEILDTQKFKK